MFKHTYVLHRICMFDRRLDRKHGRISISNGLGQPNTRRLYFGCFAVLINIYFGELLTALIAGTAMNLWNCCCVFYFASFSQIWWVMFPVGSRVFSSNSKINRFQNVTSSYSEMVAIFALVILPTLRLVEAVQVN